MLAPLASTEGLVSMDQETSNVSVRKDFKVRNQRLVTSDLLCSHRKTLKRAVTFGAPGTGLRGISQSLGADSIKINTKGLGKALPDFAC